MHTFTQLILLWRLLKTRDPFEMITALNDGAERTERLVESLKSVYHSITYYNQQLINTLNVNNVLHSHYEIFQEDVILKILRPLKIKDSVPKYKIPIQNILKLWIAEEDVIEDMVQYRLSKQNDNDEGEIRNDILRKIHYIIDTYDNLDKSLSVLLMKRTVDTLVQQRRKLIILSIQIRA